MALIPVTHIQRVTLTLTHICPFFWPRLGKTSQKHPFSSLAHQQVFSTINTRLFTVNTHYRSSSVTTSPLHIPLSRSQALLCVPDPFGIIFAHFRQLSKLYTHFQTPLTRFSLFLNMFRTFYSCSTPSTLIFNPPTIILISNTLFSSLTRISRFSTVSTYFWPFFDRPHLFWTNPSTRLFNQSRPF